jgi:antitoxin MazE
MEGRDMKAVVSAWGNSLAVRIPKDITRSLGLHDGASVDLHLEEGTIVMVPASRRHKLSELVAAITPESLHEPVDWGPSVGREQP